MLMTGDPITAQEAYQHGLVNELYPPADLMGAALRIAEKIANNSPTAVQAVKRAARMGEGEPIEQAIAIMMEAHWRSVVHPSPPWWNGDRLHRQGRVEVQGARLDCHPGQRGV
jgi:enoyl-CoA hydratase